MAKPSYILLTTIFLLIISTIPAQNATQKAQPNQARIDSILDLHFDLRNRNRPEALIQAQKALELSRKESDFHNIAVSLECIAFCHYANSDFEQAKSFYIQAMAVYSGNGEQRGVASSYNNIGMIEQDLGNFGKSLRFFQKALQIDRTINDSIGEAYTLNNIGTVYLYKGQYQKALNYFERAFHIANTINDTEGKISYYINTGLLHQSNKDISSASSCFTKAFNLSEKNQDNYSMAIALINLGNTDRDKKDFREAQRKFLTALDIIESLNDNELLTECYMAMADAFQAANDYKTSNSIILKAIKVNEETGDKRKNAFLLFLTGKNLFNDDHFMPALDYFSKSYQLAKHMGIMPLQSELCQFMSMALSATSQFDSAGRCISIYGELAVKMAIPEERLDSLAIMESDTLSITIPTYEDTISKPPSSTILLRVITSLIAFWLFLMLGMFLYRKFKKSKENHE